MNNPITMGLLGCGAMGRHVCPVNSREDIPIQVVSLFEPNTETSGQVASQYKISTVAESYEQLLSDDTLDCIGIYTPDYLHYDHVVQALEAGKHVLCTKPLVPTANQAKGLAAMANERKLKLMVGQTMRFNIRMLSARRLFEDGRLGRIHLAEAYYTHDLRTHFSHSDTWRKDGGIDVESALGCHPLDLVYWFTGRPVEVHAYGVCSGLIEGFSGTDGFVISMKFASGAIARVTVTAGIVEPSTSHGLISLSLYGSKGSYVDNSYVLDDFPGKPRHRIEYPPSEDGHQIEVYRYLKHFSDCLLNDTEPSPNAVEAADVLDIIDAVRESVNTGNSVRISV